MMLLLPRKARGSGGDKSLVSSYCLHVVVSEAFGCELRHDWGWSKSSTSGEIDTWVHGWWQMGTRRWPVVSA